MAKGYGGYIPKAIMIRNPHWPSFPHPLRLLALIALSMAVLLASPSERGLARATTVRQLTLGELIASAERVVLGTVEDKHTRWKGGRIVTEYTLRAEEHWRGDPVPTLEIVSLGGVTQSIGQHVPGSPHYGQGERVVLFLGPAGGGQFAPIGLWQGVVRLDENGEIKSAGYHTAPIHEPSVGGGPGQVPDGVHVVENPRASYEAVPLTLNDLRRRVREANR